MVETSSSSNSASNNRTCHCMVIIKGPSYSEQLSSTKGSVNFTAVYRINTWSLVWDYYIIATINVDIYSEYRIITLSFHLLLAYKINRTYPKGGGGGLLILQFCLQQPHLSLHGDNKRPILSRTTFFYKRKCNCNPITAVYRINTWSSFSMGLLYRSHYRCRY